MIKKLCIVKDDSHGDEDTEDTENHYLTLSIFHCYSAFQQQQQKLLPISSEMAQGLFVWKK